MGYVPDVMRKKVYDTNENQKVDSAEDADTVDGADAGTSSGKVFKIPDGIAQGDIFFVNASGNITRLAAGTSGHFLKTQGANADPVWAAGGGQEIVPATLVVAASDSKDTNRADYQCDGTSDQNEINNALAALPTEGGRVVLLEGTYIIDGGITGDSVDIIEGNGMENTTIKVKDGYNTDVTVLSGIGEVKNLEVDGNKANQTSGTMNGISAKRVMNCRVKQMKGGYGIKITEKALQNVVEYCDGKGIQTDGTGFIVISGNEISYCDYGIYGGNSKGVVSNNKCDYNSNHGIRFDGGRIVCLGNWLLYNGGDGIYHASGDYCTFADNIIENNDKHGIELNVTDNSIISSNTFHANGQDADDTYHDIYLREGAFADTKYVVVVGNNIEELSTTKTKYGIYEEGNAGPTVIVGNLILGCATGRISADHADTVKANNLEKAA